MLGPAARDELIAAVPDRPASGLRVETALDQLLPQLSLASQPEKERHEGNDGDYRALPHHHGSRERLVVVRRGPEPVDPVLVEGVEDRPRKEEDVAEHRLHEPDDRDIAE